MKGINWLGVVVAAVVGYLFGWLWYGILYDAQWMALAGVTPQADEANAAMGLGFVNVLVAAIGLGWLVSATGNGNLMGGVKVGVLAAIFFAGTTAAMQFIYAQADTGLIPIDGGYILISYALMGAIVGAVKMPAKAAT